MTATPCAIRRSTIVQVTQPPSGLWRFHWHEVFPIARTNGGDGEVALYLPEIESGRGRRAVLSRLREVLADVSPDLGPPLVVGGYLVQILEDRAGLLPNFRDTDLDALVEPISQAGSFASAAPDRRRQTA